MRIPQIQQLDFNLPGSEIPFYQSTCPYLGHYQCPRYCPFSFKPVFILSCPALCFRRLALGFQLALANWRHCEEIIVLQRKEVGVILLLSCLLGSYGLAMSLYWRPAPVGSFSSIQLSSLGVSNCPFLWSLQAQVGKSFPDYSPRILHYLM